jgi:hypothetical protein
MSRRRGSFVAALLIGCAVFGCTSPTAAAPAGRDISFPQCGGKLPAREHARFGVLGANGGASFTVNPCLVEQLRWSKRLDEPPAFYANTGNPGPARAKHWPLGQTSPRLCSASNPNSIGCSFDYGWNSAMHSFEVATDAAQKLHHVTRSNAHQRVANVDWWLDIETMNSWQTLDGELTRAKGERDTATIAGEVQGLWAEGVQRVGVYSTTYQWDAITGGPKIAGHGFGNVPVWYAGFASYADAVAGCGHRSFTGGAIRLTQYLAPDGFDGDVSCT